jgi:uncharacterized protein (TIGR02246 family)
MKEPTVMRVHGAFLAVLALGVTFGLVAAQERPASDRATAPAAAGKTTPPSERDSDVRAIRELLASFIKSYNEKDAKALGALFTPDAEIEDEDGEVTRGQDAIVTRFVGIFKESGAGKLAVDADSLRFLGAEIAVEEGTASISTGADTPPHTNHYSVIYARENGRWLHARIRDEQPENDPHERLTELEWMIGEWVNESDDGVVVTSCKWSDDGNFLLREFEVDVEGRIALSGTQRIGWDGQRKQFRTWVFDDRGGFADGLMSRDGDRWLVNVTGIRSDGQSVSLTSAITILGKDRLRWETFDRTLGGEAVPETDRFTLVRRAPDPGK